MNTGYFALSYKEKPISTGSHFFSCFLLVNKLYELNYKTNFRHFQKLKQYLYLRSFNLFSFKESSILTINYVFSFFWTLNCISLVWKLFISIRTILDFSAMLKLDVFYSGIFEQVTFNSWSFFKCFSWPVNCTS